MADKFQMRRDSAAAWALANPVLADGEPGFERETRRMKIGDAVTPWNGLPYVGDAAIGEADYLAFDTTPEVVPTATGTLYWDNADGNKTLSLVMDEATGTTQQIGEETYYRVKASAAIAEGHAVMVTGSVGASGVLTAARATGLTYDNPYLILGVATQSIAANAFGFVTAFGMVRGFDTTGASVGETWADGDALYYSPVNSGSLTNIQPQAPVARALIAHVIHAGTSGSVFVRPVLGSAFGSTDGNVNFTALSDNNFIVYNAATGLWENRAPAAVKTALSLGNVDNTSDADKPVSTAQQTALNAKEYSANKGVPSGYASLDAGGKVPSAQLPSFVDDVIEVANFAALPATGESGKIYVTLGDGKTWRWGGTVYAEISASPGSTDAVPEGVTNLYHTTERASAAAPVQSVAGKTGAVVLAKADVDLGNVDNTSDANKPVSTAQQTALNAKEPTIATGTTSQFWRGDKTWQDLFTQVRAAALTGLSTATSTAVAAADTVLVAIGKLQAQVSLCAAIASPTFTGTPTAPTAATTTVSTQLATTEFVADMVDRASRASIAPTLDLDFAAQRYRALDGAVGLKEIAMADILTYTGSGRTYTDALGIIRAQASNTPRIEFDPVTGAGLGLSVWGARTNLLTYSEQFDNAAWSKVRATVTANAATAPDGATTADKLVEDATAASTHYIRQTTSVTSGTAYTMSVWLKPSGRNHALLSAATSGTSLFAYFDLANGTVGSVGGGATALCIKRADGWCYCTLTAVATATETANNNIWLAAGATSGGNTYTGDGISGLFVWGAQFEAAAQASPYIPTTTASVTAPADVPNITGSNFSKFWNQSEGTLLVRYAAGSVASVEFLYASDGTPSNSLQVRYASASAAQYQVLVGGVSQTNISPVGYSTPGVFYNRAVAYKTDDFAQAINGVLVGTDTSGNVPSVTQLAIGQAGTGGNPQNGNISRILYFPRRLTNAELQALSA